MDRRKKLILLVLLQILLLRTNVVLFMVLMFMHSRRMRRRRAIRYSLLKKITKINDYMDDLTQVKDSACIVNLRMDMNCFGRLCYLLRWVGGLQDEKYVTLVEQVTMFVKILAHHDKNKVVGTHWRRSGHTISKYFNKALVATLKLHQLLLVTPKPVDVDADNCKDSWKYFKGCLGALDGTYIDVTAPRRDKPRYRCRKRMIAVNVLGVCDVNMQFVYVLCGWEGSAADTRVLRDVVHRPNDFRVPLGHYYLCDNGYPNCEGFLTPYRGKCYHLKDWGRGTVVPQDHEEYFNMRHSKAQNIIERCFGRLKGRWAILRSRMFYPLKVQNRMIMACALLHNFIRAQMEYDPLDLDPTYSDPPVIGANEFVDGMKTSAAWTGWRDQLVREMFDEWRARRSNRRN